MLKKMLDDEDRRWRCKAKMVWDNSPIHHSKIVTTCVKMLNLPIIFSGVASYDSNPIEASYSLIKRRF